MFYKLKIANIDVIIGYLVIKYNICPTNNVLNIYYPDYNIKLVAM